MHIDMVLMILHDEQKMICKMSKVQSRKWGNAQREGPSLQYGAGLGPAGDQPVQKAARAWVETYWRLEPSPATARRVASHDNDHDATPHAAPIESAVVYSVLASVLAATGRERRRHTFYREGLAVTVKVL
jgi:hypothetical protein